MATELCPNYAGMHGGCPHTIFLVTPVEFHCEQNVGCLGAAIGAEFGIGRVLKIRVVQIDIGETVTRRRQIRPRAKRWAARGSEP